MMKRPVRERPILFSGPMVRAILKGKKTQTRRVTKPQPLDGLTYHRVAGQRIGMSPDDRESPYIWCPCGAPGDHLWVRETFVLENCDTPLSDRPHQEIEDGEWGPYLVPHYRATEPEPHIVPLDLSDSYDDRTRWSPSIFMPRWASRITLEITGVRVERMQAITPADAGAEGITIDLPNAPIAAYYGRVAKFRTLWDSLNAKRSYGWDVNPWVWVIEFENQAT